MICGMSVNILAYADDIVLLAPSWKALQIMLDLLWLYDLWRECQYFGLCR